MIPFRQFASGFIALALLGLTPSTKGFPVALPAPSIPVPSGSIPSVVALKPDQLQTRWIRTEIVKTKRLVRTIERTGTLNFDEGRVSVLSSRVTGREVRILAFEGEKVRKNDPLALVYSPDFVTAEAEYLNAFKVAKTLNDRNETDSYVHAAAKKLLLMGASDDDLRILARTRKILPYLTIHAPRSGVILNSQLREGLFNNPGDQLLTIADLSKLWVTMDIYEGDLPLVHTGQTIEVRTVAYPRRVFPGRIIFQGGMVDPTTRTFHVRGEIDNPDNLLKPGMFASVTIHLTKPRPVVALPEAAFLKDDEGYHVYVQTAPGVFRVRPVVPGPEEEGYLTVEEGLAPGETVVVSGSLLLEGVRDRMMSREQGNSGPSKKGR